jgi:FkbM family methyltransferase
MSASALQIYTGINEQDLEIFERYKNPSARPADGFYTDFMGVRTRLSYFGIGGTNHDKSVGKPPFPDDGVHAEAIEYLAALYAVDTAKSSFVAVELGAGYGPWLTFSAKAAQRKGIEHIGLTAVEGDKPRHDLLRTHFADNGLPVPDETGTARAGKTVSNLIYGAISDTNGTVTFGSQSLLDWGAAPVENGASVDYRGLEVAGATINSYTIEHVLRTMDHVDFLHMDIQGYEARAVRASMNALKSKVRVMVIGTHSREIEGQLFSMLFGNGWRILYEKPCKFHRKESPSLEALTSLDGVQVWVNTELENGARSACATAQPAQEHPLEDRAHVLRRELDEAKRTISALRREVADLRHSTSWKITAPLRKLKQATRAS